MERIFTDCETGAIPPLRHWKDVTVLVEDSEALDLLRTTAPAQMMV